MHDSQIVQHLQSFDYLDEYFPDFSLLEAVAFLCVQLYLLKQISIVAVLHDNAKPKRVNDLPKRVRWLINEGFFVGDNVGRPDGSQNSDFIY